MFKALAPGGWFNKVGFADYEKLYREEILGRLDARRTFDELVALADGAEPVLLCWEKPPLTQTNWCHRRMVAEWFAEKIGIDVPELTTERASESASVVVAGKPSERARKRVAAPVAKQGLLAFRAKR